MFLHSGGTGKKKVLQFANPQEQSHYMQLKQELNTGETVS